VQVENAGLNETCCIYSRQQCWNVRINVTCVYSYIVKTQLYSLVVYWLSTALGTTTRFGH